MNLIGAALDRTRTTLASLALILVAGTVAYLEIPKEDAPDINVPVIFTKIAQSGISPEDAERLIARPVEQAMRGIDGVEEIRSEAYLGGATVTVEFDDGFDPDKALGDVREKIKIVEGELPDDAGEPTVHEVNLSLFPVLVVTLSGQVPERALTQTARDLREVIETLPAVLEARLIGARDEVVEIIVDPIKLASHGIDLGGLIRRMGRANRLVAAGNLDTGAGRFAVKVPGLFTSTEDISAMPVQTIGDAVIRIRDIATVRRTFKERSSDARLNGKRALAIEISKRIGTSIIDVSDEVRDMVAARAKVWPNGIEVAFSQDKSEKIRGRVNDLQNNVLNAVLLVMIVLIAVLGTRSAALVGIAIPGSFLLGILAISIVGFTANTVVLFALILAVGLLVDGSIVMVEYAHRQIQAGRRPSEAYSLAARHMAWPIIASTSTTLVAFLPLVFWPGTVGEFMKYLPATVLAVLAASLLMALVFIPVLGSIMDRRAARPAAVDAHAFEEIRSVDQLGRLTGLAKAYLGFLKFVLDHPVKVVTLAFCAMLWAPWMYSQHGQEIEFFPKVEGTSALVLIHARGNLSLAEQDALTREVEEIVLSFEEFKSVYTTVGRREQSGGSGPQDIIARLQLELKPWNERRPSAEILAEIKARTTHLAGIRVAVQEERTGPVRDKPIQIEVLSSRHDGIAPATELITNFLRKQEYIRDVEDSLPVPGVEWRVEIDRTQALKFGADVERVGQFVRLVTKGLKLTDYRAADADDEIDVLLRFPDRHRSLHQLDGLMIETNAGQVPLGMFAKLTPKPRRGTIRRVNGKRSALIKADVQSGIQPGEFRGEIKGYVTTSRFLDGTRARMKGEEEDEEESEDFILESFGVALFLMAIILVTQFNSFYSAGLILSAVIMSTIGVLLGLLIVDLPFGIIMSGIGVIALAGIVVNNNIVLIDTYDRLKTRGIEARDALLLTGAYRLRPVLLTSITTIAGLTPMVTQTNIDFFDRTIQQNSPASQLWVQLATSIVFGLAFATVLTLVVTPGALMLRARFDANREPRRLWMRQAFRRLAARGPVETLVTVLAVVVAWVMILEMIIVRIFDIVTKQFSNPPSVWFQAVEWSAFWTFIILTVAFAYFRDSHVRVDIIRERLSAKAQAIIEVAGFFVLLAPVCLIVMWFGLDYVGRSYADEEPSGALLGSPTGFIFKAMLPIGFLLLLLSGVTVTIRNLRLLRGSHRKVSPERDGRRRSAKAKGLEA
jgi:multidrug efflux pump